MGKSIFIILASIALAAIGQVTLKIGMNRIGALGIGSLGEVASALVRIASTPLVAVGLLLYVLAAALWLVVLSRVPLSLAYPMVALGYVVVVFLSWFALKEVVPPARWLGLVIICFGVALVGTSGR
ncbi:MAG: multidrug resistance protein [Terriglobia bacterium]